MSKKRKANIRPDLLGELFTDGKDYYTLVDCASEPSATVKDITTETLTTMPISQFANFVQLKPVRPIEKPKKTRADLGGTHKPRERKLKESELPTPTEIRGIAKDRNGDNLPDISTFSVVIGQGSELHRVCLGAQVVGCKTLKEGVTQLLAKFDIDREFVEKSSESTGRSELLAILGKKGDKLDG